MMEEALRAMILADAGVSAIVGQRVYWGDRPQGEPVPAIVMLGISQVAGHHMQGPDGVTMRRVQCDCYAETYLGSKMLERALKAAIDGKRSGILQGIFLANARDLREAGTNDADRFYRASVDFMVHHSTGA